MLDPQWVEEFVLPNHGERELDGTPVPVEHLISAPGEWPPKYEVVGQEQHTAPAYCTDEKFSTPFG
jgi:hypothetical protein